MTQVAYDVEVIVQEQNPICWVASCAMVKGFATKTSTGVGDFTGGFDPSNSCIANLAGNWSSMHGHDERMGVQRFFGGRCRRRIDDRRCFGWITAGKRAGSPLALMQRVSVWPEVDSSDVGGPRGGNNRRRQ